MMDKIMNAVLCERTKVSKARLLYEKDGLEGKTRMEGSLYDIGFGVATLIEEIAKNAYPNDTHNQLGIVDLVCTTARAFILSGDSEDVSV